MANRSQFDVVYTPVEASDLYAGSLVCLQVPVALVKIITGALEPFVYPDAWAGDDKTRVMSSRQVETFIVNILLNTCAAEASGTPGTAACGGGMVITEESMGQVVTKVEIVDGTLYVEYGPCCVEQYEIEHTIGLKFPPEEKWTEIELWPTGGGQTFSACAKATALTDVFFTAVDTLTDAAVGENAPWEAFRNINANIPGVNFGTLDLAAAYAGALGCALGGLVSEVEDVQFQQAVKCRIATMMTDDAAGLPTDQWPGVKGAVNSVISQWFNIATYPVGWVDMQRLLTFLFSAIGPNDARAITSNVPATGAENCACPTTEALPGDLFVVEYTFDFDYFNPNTSDLRDMPIEGNNPGFNYKALVVEWNGQNGGNGEIKLDDGGVRFNISRYTAPFSGKFCIHDQSAAAIGWAGLYHPTAQLIAANNLDLIIGNVASVQTLGNNVDVHTDGTMYALYDPADEV